MLLTLLLACPPSKPDTSTTSFPATTSTVCGVVSNEGSCPALPGEIQVWTIVPGGDACNDCVNDSGGGGWTEWRDQQVATLKVDDKGHFEKELPPGEYALYAGDGSCRTCEVVTVTADRCSVTTLGWEEITYVDAPNVYLYPPQPMTVQVRLGQPQALSAVDPEYPAAGWQVLATPDGTLVTQQGLRDYLYYEQQVDLRRMQTSQGWCASGATAQATLEDALGDLGFVPNEIRDFADYWDHNFPRGRWFSIYPQFEGLPALDVAPLPDSLMRVWFYVAPGCRRPEAPEWPVFQRNGFTVAEWGVALDPRLRR